MAKHHSDKLEQKNHLITDQVRKESRRWPFKIINNKSAIRQRLLSWQI